MNLAPQALGLFVCWWDHLFFHFVDVGDSLGAPISGPGTLWCYCSHRLTFSSSSFWRKSFFISFSSLSFHMSRYPNAIQVFYTTGVLVILHSSIFRSGDQLLSCPTLLFLLLIWSFETSFFFFFSLFVVEESFLI